MQRFFTRALHFHIGPVAIGNAKYFGRHFRNSTAKPDFFATVYLAGRGLPGGATDVAISALHAYGSNERKQTYLVKRVPALRSDFMDRQIQFLSLNVRAQVI